MAADEKPNVVAADIAKIEAMLALVREMVDSLLMASVPVFGPRKSGNGRLQ